jgi:hypothetical protein
MKQGDGYSSNEGGKVEESIRERFLEKISFERRAER